jgi:hypothetical protein
MEIKDPEYWRRAAKGHADTISKILWAGFLLAINDRPPEDYRKNDIQSARHRDTRRSRINRHGKRYDIELLGGYMLHLSDVPARSQQELEQIRLAIGPLMRSFSTRLIAVRRKR